MPRPTRRPTWTFTIQQKLLALILVPLVSIVAALATYFPARNLEAQQGNLEQRALSYANILSEQVRSAVAFNDKETAREAFHSLAKDPTVASVVLYTERGEVLFAHGEVGAASRAARSGVRQQHVFVLEDAIVAMAPVQSLEGPKGTLAIELSTKALERIRKQVRASAWAMGVGVLLIGMLAAFLIARSFARRLQALAGAAARVSEGDLDVQALPSVSNDEIGVLTNAFNAMLERLRALIQHIQDSARAENVRLEQMVQARTQELDSRNADMRLVFDTMGQGFVTIDVDAKMFSERSAILETWFGCAGRSAVLWDYVAQETPDLREYFVLGWSEVAAGIMPLELALAQMPSRLVAGNRSFDLDYRPIGRQGDRFERMLVVISDITARIERERAEAEEHELASLFGHLIRDRAGCSQFLAEARQLVEVVCAKRGSYEAQLRATHTLKGNAALFGAQSIASICHALEDAFENHENAIADHKQALRARFDSLSAKIGTLIGDRSALIELAVDEHRELVEAIDGGASLQAIRAQVVSWADEPMARRLERIRCQIEGLALRLGKGEIAVTIEHNHVRLPAERYADFWAAFSHAVRNAVDHGIEDADEREQNGKPRTGQIQLRACQTASEVLVQICDDGRGIDWHAVRELAAERGLPNTTREELVDVLFHSGLSTRDVVTEISGRGVGLHALREACVALGGRVSVESEPNRFTRFSFSWPLDRMHPHNGAIVRQPLAVVGGLR